MNLSFSHKQKRELSSLVMVTTSGIQLIVFEGVATQKARVFFSKEVLFPKHWKGTERQFNSLNSSALYQLLHDAERILKTHSVSATIREQHFFYAYPLGIWDVEKIVLNSGTRKTLTEDLLKGGISEAEKRFLGKSRSSKMELGVQNIKHVITEQAFDAATLDGYPVTEYLFRPFSNFSVYLRMGSVRAVLAQKLTDVFHSVFGTAKIVHKTVDTSLFEAVLSDASAPSNFLHCTIAAHGTSLVVVHNRVPVNRTFFNFGEDQMLAKLSSEVSESRSLVSSHLTLYAEGALHGESEKYYEKALSITADAWKIQFIAARQALSENFILPKPVLLFPYSDLVQLMASKLQTTDTDTFGAYEILPVSEKYGLEIQVLDTHSVGPIAKILIRACSKSNA